AFRLDIVGQRHLVGQVDAPLRVDTHHADLQRVANFGDILDALDEVGCQLVDPDQAFLAWQNLHEGADVHHALDGAVVFLANLDILGDGADRRDGALRRLAVGGGDIDRAVVFDLDRRAGVLLDLADHLAAGADDRADLVWTDLDRDDARRVGGHLLPRRRDDGGHLLQDEETAVPRLREGVFHDV